MLKPAFQPKTPFSRLTRGFTLIELVIVIAILTVIAGIAIPAYNGYIREARITSARINIEPLRLALEDHWLDNGVFVEGVWTSGSQTLQSGALGWSPDGDRDGYDYSVSFVGGSNQVINITVTHREQADEPQWVIVNRIP